MDSQKDDGGQKNKEPKDSPKNATAGEEAVSIKAAAPAPEVVGNNSKSQQQ